MIQPNFVAGYIVDRSDAMEPLYLLLRRSQETYLPGIWQMVTGKLEANEVAGAAIHREMMEETGLTSTEVYNVDVTMFYDQFKGRIAFSANFCAFVSKSQAVTLSAREHDTHKWCTYEEALELIAFPSQKETLMLIHRHYVVQKAHEVNVLKYESKCNYTAS